MKQHLIVVLSHSFPPQTVLKMFSVSFCVSSIHLVCEWRERVVVCDGVVTKKSLEAVQSKYHRPT